jgi:hypothetical protein
MTIRPIKRVVDKGLKTQRTAEGWVYADTYKIPGKRYELVKGRDLKVEGTPRGSRFRFHEVVVRPDGAVWLNVYGGSHGKGQWHSFHPSRVTWVSRNDPNKRGR